jgi:hypothetical protein
MRTPSRLPESRTAAKPTAEWRLRDSHIKLAGPAPPYFPLRLADCGGEFQFIIGLIEQILGPLRVALHVPLVRLLRVHDPLPDLPAQALGGGQVRMAAGRKS